nr:biorientation of chromosomes in cell division protein 1-like 1 isoform X1 [Helicoverpa armigera]
MAHLQYMPGDPRLVDQLVYELKSKGIFDQFRKDCIADVDTRPAYQNLRQRVENSVSSFLSRQCWKPDLNKNQLREKLRKHILDGNYLEQGVERIVDQVVNPKVASVFIPQVEDLVYNYLGISRKKSVTAETSNGKLSTDDLLPTDLEAVSPGSVKSNDDKSEAMDDDFGEENKMDVDIKDEDKTSISEIEKPKVEGDSQPTIIEINTDSDMETEKPMTMHEDIKLENIPPPDNSPPKVELENIDIEKIELPKEPNIGTEVPNPGEIPLPKDDKEQFFKPIGVPSDDDSSSDSSLRRNMSPLTPIRNYNNENSCDAQQAFENDSDSKSNDKKEPSSFRFAIDAKSAENSQDGKPEKKDPEQANLAYQFNNQVNINTFNTPLYDDSSNSNNLHIDYESDVNSKLNAEKVPEADQNSEDKRDKKGDDRKSSHKSSHRSRDSHRHSSSKDKRSDSKQGNSRDSSRHDKKSKDEHSKSKSSHREREKSRERSDKKDSRDSSKHRSSSHKSSSSHRDSKSHRSSSSSQKHSSEKRSSDDKKSSSSQKSERSSEKSSDRSSRDKRDSKSSSHRSDKDRKSSSSRSKHDDKDKKKEKKETDDHYSLSGRGNHGRRSTDRDSNDGSSSSKGSQNQSGTKPTENKKESKGSSSKSDNTSTTSGESTSPSDKEHGIITANETKNNQKPIRVENHLETPIASPPRLPFVPDVTLKKPKFAANLEEAKRMMKMRKFLDEEQKRMNQEAALLLEFQANVRPSLSQVYSSIPGPELEFACIAHEVNNIVQSKITKTEHVSEETVPLESKATDSESNIKDVTTKIMQTADKNKVTNEIIDELEETLTNDSQMFDETETKPTTPDKNETYNENKPFSQLMEEISEYSKASEKNKKDALDNLVDDDKKRTEYFEVTIITEELSETDDSIAEPMPEAVVKPEQEIIENPENPQPEITENPEQEISKDSKVEVIEIVEVPKVEITEIPEVEITEIPKVEEIANPEPSEPAKKEEETLKYFAEHEKFDAELKRHQYSDFLKSYTERNLVSDKIHVINCDPYEENIIKEVCSSFGNFEVINYFKNGHLKLPKTSKNVIKNVNLASEISLPVDNSCGSKSPSLVFSPVKSECSFELSSDYDAKLEEMVNKTSRQEVMEIILGNVIDENPSIDYCTESSIDNDLNLKRKIVDDGPENNNKHVLKKVRKLSDSDQISSTTEESEEISNNNRVTQPTRSKYLGRARRVGLARPRRNNLPNSPSSDKSVENYEQNTQATPTAQTPNGKFKTVTRNKVQRYDTSDLYKPKLHYLSRRNNIS